MRRNAEIKISEYERACRSLNLIPSQKAIAELRAFYAGLPELPDPNEDSHGDDSVSRIIDSAFDAINRMIMASIATERFPRQPFVAFIMGNGECLRVHYRHILFCRATGNAIAA